MRVQTAAVRDARNAKQREAYRKKRIAVLSDKLTHAEFALRVANRQLSTVEQLRKETAALRAVLYRITARLQGRDDPVMKDVRRMVLEVL